MDICIELLDCVIPEGKASRTLCEAILGVYVANRVELKLISHCLNREIEINGTFSFVRYTFFISPQIYPFLYFVLFEHNHMLDRYFELKQKN
jgi:hypothetical protein